MDFKYDEVVMSRMPEQLQKYILENPEKFLEQREVEGKKIHTVKSKPKPVKKRRGRKTREKLVKPTAEKMI